MLFCLKNFMLKREDINQRLKQCLSTSGTTSQMTWRAFLGYWILECFMLFLNHTYVIFWNHCCWGSLIRTVMCRSAISPTSDYPLRTLGRALDSKRRAGCRRASRAGSDDGSDDDFHFEVWSLVIVGQMVCKIVGQTVVVMEDNGCFEFLNFCA